MTTHFLGVSAPRDEGDTHQGKGQPIGVMILVIIALSLKLLVPTGYMLQSQDSGIAISVCSDSTGIAKTIEIPAERGGKNSADHHQADSPCPYTALGMSALGTRLWRCSRPPSCSFSRSACVRHRSLRSAP